MCEVCRMILPVGINGGISGTESRIQNRRSIIHPLGHSVKYTIDDITPLLKTRKPPNPWTAFALSSSLNIVLPMDQFLNLFFPHRIDLLFYCAQQIQYRYKRQEKEFQGKDQQSQQKNAHCQSYCTDDL